MSAKHKLNSMHFYTKLVIAGLIGSATGSFAVFLFVLAALVAIGIHSGDIRK